jgi:hypothetical protein
LYADSLVFHVDIIEQARDPSFTPLDSFCIPYDEVGKDQ